MGLGFLSLCIAYSRIVNLSIHLGVSLLLQSHLVIMLFFLSKLLLIILLAFLRRASHNPVFGNLRPIEAHEMLQPIEQTFVLLFAPL
jgi:hypothetical protein